jgi:hypothetical protein
MNIYPNPPAGVVNIDIDLKKNEYGTVSIIDIKGNTVFKTDIDSNSVPMKVETDLYQPGIYLVKYTSSLSDDFTTKLVITK